MAIRKDDRYIKINMEETMVSLDGKKISLVYDTYDTEIDRLSEKELSAEYSTFEKNYQDYISELYAQILSTAQGIVERTGRSMESLQDEYGTVVPGFPELTAIQNEYRKHVICFHSIKQHVELDMPAGELYEREKLIGFVAGTADRAKRNFEDRLI